MPLSTRAVTARATVMHVAEQDTVHGHVFVQGVRFEDLSIDDRDAIEMHCTQHAVPAWRKKHRQSVDLISRAAELVRNSRSSFRRKIELPALVTVTHDDGRVEETPALLEEISSTGAGLLMENPLPPGTAISLQVPGTALRGTGEVVFSRALESPMRVSFAVGVRLERAAFRAEREAALRVMAAGGATSPTTAVAAGE
jgi:hypothetical protein